MATGPSWPTCPPLSDRLGTILNLPPTPKRRGGDMTGPRGRLGPAERWKRGTARRDWERGGICYCLAYRLSGYALSQSINRLFIQRPAGNAARVNATAPSIQIGDLAPVREHCRSPTATPPGPRYKRPMYRPPVLGLADMTVLVPSTTHSLRHDVVGIQVTAGRPGGLCCRRPWPGNRQQPWLATMVWKGVRSRVCHPTPSKAPFKGARLTGHAYKIPKL